MAHRDRHRQEGPAVLIEERQHFTMANSAEDYDRLMRALPGPARIALEPTGAFHRTLAYRLLREGFLVVSSVVGARYREAMFNSWTDEALFEQVEDKGGILRVVLAR